LFGLALEFFQRKFFFRGGSDTQITLIKSACKGKKAAHFWTKLNFSMFFAN